MKLTLIYRKKDDGISISKIFDIILPYLSKSFKVERTFLPGNTGNMKGIITNIKHIMSLKKSRIFHITGAAHYLSLFLPKSRTITTVHDFGRLEKSGDSWLKSKILSLLFVMPLRHNRFIVCISEKTRNEFFRYVKFPSERVFIIPDPVSDLYQISPKDFDYKSPRILHIGTKKNKNLSRTLSALKGIPCKLIVIGKASPKTVIELEKSEIQYELKQNLSEEELLKEYKEADIVNFPSTYEGFGMPIIEAQAIGRPCITSDIEPMKSVAGQGALLCNPYDIASIREAYLTLLSDKNIWEQLVSAGSDNVKKYRAENVASSYIEIYKKINE